MSDKPQTVPANVERHGDIIPGPILRYDLYAVLVTDANHLTREDIVPLTFDTYDKADRAAQASRQSVYRAGLTVDVSQPAEAGR